MKRRRAEFQEIANGAGIDHYVEFMELMIIIIILMMTTNRNSFDVNDGD
jgi:hypothetical protein